MARLNYRAMESERAEALWNGGPDDYGLAPERRLSDGNGVPCRHCLGLIEAGADYLVFAFRPFSSLQPYAETGPVFLHAERCANGGGVDMPDMLRGSADFILRGYGPDERIVYGTGGVVPVERIEARAQELLARDDIASVHVRSARNNCFQCRIERD